MWLVLERASVRKDLRRCPAEIKQKFEAWKALVQQQGPDGLRVRPGYHDEALKGQLVGLRSSRLGSQYRVLYAVDRATSLLEILGVIPHDYGRIRG